MLHELNHTLHSKLVFYNTFGRSQPLFFDSVFTLCSFVLRTVTLSSQLPLESLA